MPQQAWDGNESDSTSTLRKGCSTRNVNAKPRDRCADRQQDRVRTGGRCRARVFSTDIFSSGRRGGLRSHSVPRGRTRDQLYEEARHWGSKVDPR